MTDIAKIRLLNQQITRSNFKTARELVGWMGAMQAQDLAMAKWAVGSRLPGSTEQEIEAALNAGEILRTHVLRPTWHLVSSEDIYWILDLTAPQIKATLKSRQKQLGLSDEVLAKSARLLEQLLRDGEHLAREELIAEFSKNGIDTNENRASHLFMYAELEGLICSGAAKDKHQTYALLADRVPNPVRVGREEALARLAGRYFASHGPATLQDYAWWSGLSLRDARQGLELAMPGLISENIAGQTCWFSDHAATPLPADASLHLLPAFDEFIISYTDRSASLPDTDKVKMISDNGIFWPIIVVGGKVVGTWKRTVKPARVIVEAGFFQQPDPAALRQLEEAAAQYGSFLGKPADLVYAG